MKQTILILFSCCLGFTLGQQSSYEVHDCFSKLKRYTQDIKMIPQNANKSAQTTEEMQYNRPKNAKSDVKRILNAMSPKQLLSIAKEINEAVIQDPIEFQKQLIQDEIEINNKVNSGNHNSIPVHIFITILQNQLIENNFTQLANYLRTPILLRVKVNNIDSEIYKTKDRFSASLSQTNIICTVKDIIKGHALFDVNDEFNFYYMDFWKKTNKQFIEGNEYFVSVGIKILDDGSVDYALIPDRSDGIYPIYNDKVKDDNNLLGVGDEINWNKLKNKFQKEYINF